VAYLVLVFFLIFLFPLSLYAQPSPRIESFSPVGIVKEPTQVSVRFSQDMVAIGDPGIRSDIFETTCKDLGIGRWMDSRNWVLDLKTVPEGGKECRFELKEFVRSLNGRSVEGQRSFSFSTGGVNILYSYPWSEVEIAEDQVFLLRVDGEVSFDSVLRNAFILQENSGEKIGLNRVPENRLQELMQAAHWTGEDQRLVIGLSPKTNLSPSARIRLVWSKGIQSKDGITNDQDQFLDFTVRPRFQASVYCERESAQRNCIPLRDIELRFSAPVPVNELKGIYMLDSSGKKIPASLNSKYEKSNVLSSVIFQSPFLEKSVFKIFLPSSLRDDSGRSLSNSSSFPMEVRTDRYPPLAKFSSTFGVIEWKASPILPVTIRNLEGTVTGSILTFKPSEINIAAIRKWMSLVHNREENRSVFRNETKKPTELQVPKVMQDGSMEVVGIPLLKPGMYVVELKSRILGQSLTGGNTEFYVPTIALVTNLGLHFKWGRESSLVWVTELSSGKPVEGVEVGIYDCSGKAFFQGKSAKDGTVQVSSLPDRSKISYCSWKNYENGLFIIASTGEDAAFLHTTWNQGLEAWRFHLPYVSNFGEQIFHTFLDRTLFRTGETVSMKNTVRKHSMKGFVSPDLKSLPSYILIKHEGSDTKYYKPVKWGFPGTSALDWKIPRNAHLGTYSIYLANSTEDEWGAYRVGEFRVEEFRLPILKATISSPRMTWVGEERIPITLQAGFLSGGQASGLPVSFRYRIAKDPFQPQGWENYIFSSAPIKTGKVNIAQDSHEEKGYETVNLVLDREGMGQTTVSWKNRKEVSLLHMEMEFRDPNGETQSVASRIRLLPSNQHVGIASNLGLMSQENLRLETVVVDSLGKSVSGASVEVYAFQRQEYVHRKRLVGGFYSYEYYTEVEALGKVCNGKTDSQGSYICKPTNFKASGDLLFEARSADPNGNTTYASASVWIADTSDWWYSASDSDRMDLIPDKRRYVVGDKARLRVEAPFSEYTALVTLEREGILRSYVREMNGKNPYLEIPIEKEFVPNAFLSVLAVRGRVGAPKETAIVDLARPSFRLGLREIKVGWDPYELKVDVRPDRKDYKIRSKGELRISVSHGGKPVSGGEVAIAIVDEALLELYQNPSLDILAAMMGSRGLEVESYTLMMQVVGKRHFGKKALPVGGGGGNQPTRELFDTLLYWNPEIQLDKKGEAIVPFQLKDSLTSYRVLVVATSGTDLFGSGQARFHATQDVLLFSGLPPVVRTGDRFFQEFTLKNNSGNSMSLSLSLSAEGANGRENFPEQNLNLQPGESKKVSWETQVGEKPGERIVKMEVVSKEKKLDSLKITQKIEDSIPVRTTQGTLFRIEKGSRTLPISLPAESLAGKGGVHLRLASTILASTQGIRQFMREYPFTCLEQKVSKAIVLDDKKEREAILNELPSYLDADGLLKYFPNSPWGDEILTATVLVLLHEAGWKIPKDSFERMKTGLNRYLDGNLIRYRQYDFNDSLLRRIQILESLSRYESVGFRLSGLDPDIKLLPNSTLLQWIQLLKRETGFPSQKAFLQKAEENLRARLNLQGSEMTLQDKRGDLWWLMRDKDLDSATFISYASESDLYKQDLGRLIQGFTSRMKNGRFSTTLANSFAYLSMKKLSNTVEKEKVSGVTKVNLGSMERNINWESLSDFSSSFPLNQIRDGQLQILHEGEGKPWAFVSTEAAIPLKKSIENGIRIRKEITPLMQKVSGKWSVGDVAKIRIQFELSTSRTWIVLQDPIPTGSVILGTGLGRNPDFREASTSDSSYYLSFQERGFSSYKAYYEYLPGGKYFLEYNLRINQEGKFTLPPTRAEAMYSPDIYGEIPNGEWVVLP